MERKVACVTIANGSNYDDCRSIDRIGYELRDGIYERSPEYIHRRINDGEEFYIKSDGEKRYLQAVKEETEEPDDDADADNTESTETDGAAEEDGDDEDGSEEEDEEDVRTYVRVADEDTPDDPLLQLESC